MPEINSQQAGVWSDTSTWDTGTIPTASDVVHIKHAVTVRASFTALTIRIEAGGSLTVLDSYKFVLPIVANVGNFVIERVLDDTRAIRLDGVLFNGTKPSISSTPPSPTDGFPETVGLFQEGNGDIIINDPGYIGASATLQDIKPEGIARAYVRKVSNNVRYLTATVRIRASKPYYLGSLYRMAEGPFQVLLVTNTTLIKGFIENISPDPSSVGTEYITVKVTVAEGP